MDIEEFFSGIEKKQKIIASQRDNDNHPAGKSDLFYEYRNMDVFNPKIKFNGRTFGSNKKR